MRFGAGAGWLWRLGLPAVFAAVLMTGTAWGQPPGQEGQSPDAGAPATDTSSPLRLLDGPSLREGASRGHKRLLFVDGFPLGVSDLHDRQIAFRVAGTVEVL